MITATLLLNFGFFGFVAIFVLLCNYNVVLEKQGSIKSSESKLHFEDAKPSFVFLVTKSRENFQRIRRDVLNVISTRINASLEPTPSLFQRPSQAVSASTDKSILTASVSSIKSFSATLMMPSASTQQQQPPIPPPPIIDTPSVTSTQSLFPTISTISPPTYPTPPPKPPQQPNCSYPYSCKGRCLAKVLPQDGYPCLCDPVCELFYDCCADYDRYCNSTSDHSIPKHTRGLWKCQKQFSPYSWMIDRCPSSWPNFNDIVNCTNNRNPKVTYDNYAEVLPVVDKESSIIYKNRYCAKCNGVESKNMESYGLEFSCTLAPPHGLSQEETLKFLFKYCYEIKPKPKKGQTMRKCGQIEENCFLVASLKKQCKESPPRIVYFSDKSTNYKNIYCAMCNVPVSPNNLICGPLVTAASLQPVPFSIIMDISVKNEDKQLRKVKTTCDEDEVYDIYLELCRSTVSQLPSTPVLSHFEKYRIALWLTLSYPSKLNIAHFKSSVIEGIISQNFGLNNSQIEFKEWQIVPKTDVVVLFLDVQKSKSQKRRRSKREFNQDINSILNFTRPLNLQWRSESFTIIKATVRRLTCINIKYYSPDDYTLLQNSSNVYINETQEILKEREYFGNQTEVQNDKRIPVGIIAVCGQKILEIDCANGTRIILDSDEYVILSNQSVYRNVSNIVYNKDEYYKTDNGSVVVCNHFSKQYTKVEEQEVQRDGHDKALTLLTRIGLSLSVICLAATLITYTLFGELRTLPGINLMNLSSALLAAHLFWLIGSGLVAYHRACVAMAVTLHFLFLASFMWMSIIAFSTWRAFSNSGRRIGASNDKEYRRKRIRRTLAIGWLPVLVFAAICASLDLSKAVSIQYGGSKGCWINNGTANLCIFVIPVVMAMIWNAVFFGLTVRSIQKVRQQASMATEQRESQNSYSVYIKIAVLMGFTWICGVLGSFVSAYLMFPFVVLCILQGVYIAFSFTFTRRVLALYTTKFGQSSRKKSTSGTNSQGVKPMDTRI